LFLVTNSIYGYQQTNKQEKRARKKKKQGKTNEEEGRKKYYDFSKYGLPDFVSGLVLKLHGIPYFSYTKHLRVEALFW
jgi:hypothetical protein